MHCLHLQQACQIDHHQLDSLIGSHHVMQSLHRALLPQASSVPTTFIQITPQNTALTPMPYIDPALQYQLLAVTSILLGHKLPKRLPHMTAPCLVPLCPALLASS